MQSLISFTEAKCRLHIAKDVKDPWKAKVKWSSNCFVCFMFLIPEITVWIEKQSGGSNHLCFLTRKKKHPLLEGMYQGSSAGPNVGSGQASLVREEGNMLALYRGAKMQQGGA